MPSIEPVLPAPSSDPTASGHLLPHAGEGRAPVSSRIKSPVCWQRVDRRTPAARKSSADRGHACRRVQPHRIGLRGRVCRDSRRAPWRACARPRGMRRRPHPGRRQIGDMKAMRDSIGRCISRLNCSASLRGALRLAGDRGGDEPPVHFRQYHVHREIGRAEAAGAGIGAPLLFGRNRRGSPAARRNRRRRARLASRRRAPRRRWC